MDIIGKLFGYSVKKEKDGIDYLVNKIANSEEVKACDSSSIFYDVLNNLGDNRDVNIDIIAPDIDTLKLSNEVRWNLNKNIKLYGYNGSKSLSSFWVFDKKSVFIVSSGYLITSGEIGDFGFVNERPIWLDRKLLFDFYKNLKNSEQIYL